MDIAPIDSVAWVVSDWLEGAGREVFGRSWMNTRTTTTISDGKQYGMSGLITQAIAYT